MGLTIASVASPSKVGPPKRSLKLRLGYDASKHVAEPGLMAVGMRGLWRAGQLCDLTVLCRGSTFRAHKVVLARHSKELLEAVKDGTELELDCISYPEAAQLFLEHVYETGLEKEYAPSTAAVNLDVLHLAHRFGLNTLKRVAAAHMAQNVTTINVIEVLKKSTTFELTELREHILNHIACSKKIMRQVTAHPEIANHPEVLQEILVRVSSPELTNPSKRARRSIC